MRRNHRNCSENQDSGGARSRIRTGNLSLIWRSGPVRSRSAYKAAALPLSYPGARGACAGAYEEMVGGTDHDLIVMRRLDGVNRTACVSRHGREPTLQMLSSSALVRRFERPAPPSPMLRAVIFLASTETPA